jgi:hypothetical protein
MSPEFGNTPSIQERGYTLEQIATMARLGLVFSGIAVTQIDGTEGSSMTFTFVPDSPLGRANKASGHDDFEMELLINCIDDARHLSYLDFKTRYPGLGPYENPGQQG